MAKIGRPIMLGVQTTDLIRSRLEKYAETMLEAGFDDEAVENALDQTWISKNVFVANSYDEAREIAEPGFRRERKHFREAREKFNPDGFRPQASGEAMPPSEDFGLAFIVGTPAQVADQIAELRDAGVRNLMMKLNVGEMPSEPVHKSIKLLGEKVLPILR